MKTQWKKRAAQTSLLAVIATIAFGAVTASAADTNKDTKLIQGIQISQPEGSKPVMMFRATSASSGLLMQPSHERNYWKLLASTYAPETLSDWKKALEDRKQVENEFPKPTFAKKVIITKDAATGKTDEKALTEDGTLQMEGLSDSVSAVPALPAVTINSNGEITPPTKDIMIKQLVTQALPFEGAVAGDIMKAELPESFKRQQKLTEAVEADDTAAIKNLLPELLKDYVKQTEELRELTKKLKTDIQTPTEK
ncbi:hypothetical protein GC102_25300 [Paenibacillus sp. LMG 31460]|uniref:Uncharacterized protein n=1 Tax=Paenibacillus germinis TaxID=2654979 RepID=A0ABX1Z6N1_9BACL|nr:hypothetical protein [Paenibacillus germinis]NOU89038.1 hypothetical protein [Paenibacillus germinis]